MFRRYKLKNFDFLLVLLVIALNVIGILAIGSAKQSVQSKQILGMAVGLIAMLVIAFLDYSRLLKLAWIGYLFVIVTLILVHFFGRSANGAARWLDLGFFDLQPSETAKILLILFYAQFIMKYREQFNTMRVLLLAVLFIIPPLILIYKQPNLSTTILVSVLFCVLMFVGGLSWKIIGGVLAVAVPSVLIFLSIVMQEGQTLIKDYQRNRIMAFFDPATYADTEAYQQLNSVIAIGSGQLWGKGLIPDGLYLCYHRGGAWLYRFCSGHFAADPDCNALCVHRAGCKGYRRNGYRCRNRRTDRNPGLYEYCSRYHDDAKYRITASVCQLWAEFASQYVYRNRLCLKCRASAKKPV